MTAIVIQMKSAEPFGAGLQYLLKMYGWTNPTSLAAAVRLAPSTIGRIHNGEKPGGRKAREKIVQELQKYEARITHDLIIKIGQDVLKHSGTPDKKKSQLINYLTPVVPSDPFRSLSGKKLTVINAIENGQSNAEPYKYDESAIIQRPYYKRLVEEANEAAKTGDDTFLIKTLEGILEKIKQENTQKDDG